jgi:hypothetical protein
MSILVNMSIELIRHMITILTYIYDFSYSMTSIVLIDLIHLDTLLYIEVNRILCLIDNNSDGYSDKRTQSIIWNKIIGHQLL